MKKNPIVSKTSVYPLQTTLRLTKFLINLYTYNY